MKVKSVFILLLGVFFQSAFAQKQELIPYLSFLEDQKTSSIDYIFDLFERYDIVVLGERDGRDSEQKLFMAQLVADPRFVEKVGNVFTQIGGTNWTEKTNEVLKATYPSEAQFEDNLLKLCRELNFFTLMERYGDWMFLQALYRVNKDLPMNQKINTYMIDDPYDWSQCLTAEQRQKDVSDLYRKDHENIKGQNFIRYYEEIAKSPAHTRKKALVILENRSAMKPFQAQNSDWYYSTTHTLLQAYPGKVANVLINTFIFGEQGKDCLLGAGKWDAAFRHCGNPSIGFDLKDSPFGNDLFKLYLRPIEPLGYKDIYHGFVFYKPIEEWNAQIGIPGIVDQDFLPEIIRRNKLHNPQEAIKFDDPEFRSVDKFQYYTTLRTVSTYSKDTPKEEIEKYINTWLE